MRQSSGTRTAPSPAAAPEREPSPEELAFRSNPVLFAELARDWAMGGEAPTEEHEAWLRAIPRRRIRQPGSAREAFWALLASPHRARALEWLDRHNLLEELVPIWFGDARLRALHLRAVEELHREGWADGLSARAMNLLRSYMDERVDGRITGWGLAALATLLLESNGATGRYNERLNEELRELGATDAERMRVMTAIVEYPFLRSAFRYGDTDGTKFSPTTVVAALSTLFADERATGEQRARAVKLADELLSR